MISSVRVHCPPGGRAETSRFGTALADSGYPNSPDFETMDRSRHDREERSCSAPNFGTGQVLWSIVWFTLFFIWIWLLIVVFADIFRSHDLGGFAKFLWVLFVIVVPYLGVFVYLIARGNKMGEHAVEDAQAADAAQRAYIRDAAGTSASSAEELERLATLKSEGVIDDAEFARMKSQVVAGQ